MATAAVIGLNTAAAASAGKRLLGSSSSSYSDISEKLSFSNNDHSSYSYSPKTTTTTIVANFSSSSNPSPNHQHASHPIRALRENVEAVPSSSTTPAPPPPPWFHDSSDLEALLLLQKSMLEKQWTLSFQRKKASLPNNKQLPITCSGVSARQRRITSRKKPFARSALTATAAPNLQNHYRFKGYVKGVVSEDLLSHAEVVRLSHKIKIGLSLDDHKSRLKERLGCEPSDEQLATSLKISRAELQSKMIESSLAREKLAMSNVRLVMSIAQRYDNMGAEMADLVQGGLIGLLRGIEKFDSSKGFRISTYVYWWIRQGVSRALVENSRTLRLPTHLHERLSSIKNAKLKLEEKGITPSIDRIAESLNMSKKKVRNATEAISKVFSLDRDAFPSLNGLPGETHHSYVADKCPDNIPWHGVDEWALKEEVNKLMNTTLGERERDIIRLYYGLDNECLTWEDISKRIGLSRERVRQVGLVAMEKLKHGARRRKMEAMLVKQ
ncbi:RNA polymerase sigma factor sigA-like [Humulus lupulus]|uniref:RNA polymerase sigma factor sigA-like n=1 Tax=Humulus lupulus TaxID=3486 RepID=UPI002B40EE6A|nr:RNA polymerase sigma factor sigA-like [Humulus lupulus]XP_062119689.1 RNA polymerase sigma factor sigA-like [Humulus lupulus]